MTIREERPEDVPAIRRVLNHTFESADEALLVDAFHMRGATTLALVAVRYFDMMKLLDTYFFRRLPSFQKITAWTL